MKVCRGCHQSKDETEFSKDKRGKNGLRAQCRVCVNDYGKAWFNYTALGRFHRIRNSSKMRNILFEINIEEFKQWFNSQPKTCYYCLREIQMNSTLDMKLDGLTIDRKDNNKGYNLRNIVLACKRCNVMKGAWLSEQQTIEIARKYFSVVREQKN